MKEEIIYGKNPVIEALRSGRELNRIWVGDNTKPHSMQAIYDEARKRGVIISRVPRSRIEEMANNSSHQGVIAFAAAYQYTDLDQLLEQVSNKIEAPFLVMLDELEDPHNLGSILRTADATGVDGVIIPKRRAVGLTQIVAKASAGAIEYVPVCRVTNLVQTIEKLKEHGFWSFGTDAKGELDFRQADYKIPTLLIIGSEGKGISRLVGQKCDFLVKLPMVGQVTSLNASVAAALMMYEVLRQRLPLAK